MKHFKLYEHYHNNVEHLQYDITLENEVQLYHYTKLDLGNEVILSPEESKNKRLSWSMREYKRSDIPRVFYYVNVKKTERSIVENSNFLYTGFVNGKDIIKVSNAIRSYNKNPQEFEKLNPNAYNSVKEFVDKGSSNYNILFENLKHFFKGAYYKFENEMEVVILFQSLKVFQIDYIQ